MIPRCVVFPPQEHVASLMDTCSMGLYIRFEETMNIWLQKKCLWMKRDFNLIPNWSVPFDQRGHFLRIVMFASGLPFPATALRQADNFMWTKSPEGATVVRIVDFGCLALRGRVVVEGW